MINSVNFVNNVVKITSGSFFGQLTFALTTPIITRIYDPDVFGYFAIYSAVVRIVSAISSLRYEMALLISKKEKDANHLFLISVVSVFITSFCAYLTLSIFSLFNFFDTLSNLIGSYKEVICLGIFLWGLINIFNSSETRSDRFANIGILKFIRPFVTALVTIVYGLTIKSSYFGLFIGDLIGTLIGLLFVFFRNMGYYKLNIFKNISFEHIFFLIKKYKRFPLFGTWEVLINSLMIQLPVILISNFQPVAVVGFFALANRILLMPMTLFNSGVSQVFLKNASDNKSFFEVNKLIKKTLRRLLMLSVFPLIVIILVGEDLFLVVFGKNWSDAGKYIEILSWWGFSAFLVQPLSQLIYVYEKQKEALIISLGRLFARLGTLCYCLILDQDIISTLMYFSFAGCISNILFLRWLLNITKCSLSSIFQDFLKYLIISTVFIIPLIVSKYFLNISSIQILIVSIFLVVFYGIYLIITDDGLKKLLIQSFNQNKKLKK